MEVAAYHYEHMALLRQGGFGHASQKPSSTQGVGHMHLQSVVAVIARDEQKDNKEVSADHICRC